MLSAKRTWCALYWARWYCCHIATFSVFFDCNSEQNTCLGRRKNPKDLTNTKTLNSTPVDFSRKRSPLVLLLSLNKANHSQSQSSTWPETAYQIRRGGRRPGWARPDQASGSGCTALERKWTEPGWLYCAVASLRAAGLKAGCSSRQPAESGGDKHG